MDPNRSRGVRTSRLFVNPLSATFGAVVLQQEGKIFKYWGALNGSKPFQGCKKR